MDKKPATIREIIAVAKTIDAFPKDDWIDLEPLATDLQVAGHERFWSLDPKQTKVLEDDFSKVWISRHYCTDTYVGVWALEYRGEPFAMCEQQGRKCHVTFNYLCNEAVFEEVFRRFDEILAVRPSLDRVNRLSLDDTFLINPFDFEVDDAYGEIFTEENIPEDSREMLRNGI